MNPKKTLSRLVKPKLLNRAGNVLLTVGCCFLLAECVVTGIFLVAEIKMLSLMLSLACGTLMCVYGGVFCFSITHRRLMARIELSRKLEEEYDMFIIENLESQTPDIGCYQLPELAISNDEEEVVVTTGER